MIELWREWLYPLGFLSSLAFTARMLVQWLSSESQGKSFVTPLFWKLSLIGNTTLAIHSLLQVQFHVCLIQVCNAIISWRNLNLMQSTEKQISTKSTIIFLCCGAYFTSVLFLLQGHYLLENTQEWFRIPVTPWSHTQTPLHFAWHLFGFFGLALFSSRFWFQWWSAEKKQRSYLGPTFWWISLIGEAICLIYFVKIHDPVNFIGPAFAMIPYIRNLMLLKSPKASVT